MDNPNYVLKGKEGVLVHKNEKSIRGYLKLAILIIWLIIIVSFIIFQDNLFKSLSLIARIMLISLTIWVYFTSESKEKIELPFEIWFYDDYLILYRQKHYYSRKLTRKEFDKFFYKDIHKCQYRTVTGKINIYGVVEGVWYNYNKDGTLPNEPTYHKTTDSIRQFYITAVPEINFVEEIEMHSPIKVVITES